MVRKKRIVRTTPSLLADLGVIGMEPIEPVILAALVTEEPLLLIGPHGTAKSYLLNRISIALGLRWRHYNASLLNFDDLVGYPLPNGNGGLQYAQTPSSIWDAEVAFFDEISRCRPDLQNKLFPIIHERRVQGIALDKLLYRWSAMNPPLGEADDDHGYRGSEPLDQALADRFAFIVEMPAWDQFNEQQQEQIILCGHDDISPEAARRLRERIESGRRMLPSVQEVLSDQLATYVRLVIALLGQADLVLSPRRGGMLLRDVLAVHTARLLVEPDANLGESCLLALTHSFPQRALGVEVGRIKVLECHREAWRASALDVDDPRRLLIKEPDPLRRALRAARIADLSSPEFSGIIADCLASLRPGGRQWKSDHVNVDDTCLEHGLTFLVHEPHRHRPCEPDVISYRVAPRAKCGRSSPRVRENRIKAPRDSAPSKYLRRFFSGNRSMA